jgi:hypothetical protein
MVSMSNYDAQQRQLNRKLMLGGSASSPANVGQNTGPGMWESPAQPGGGGPSALDGYLANLRQQQQNNSALFTKLYNEYQAAQDAAAKANKGREKEVRSGYTDMHGRIVGGYGDIRNRAMGYIDKLGGTQRQDIGDRYTQLRGEGEQDMISRGLSNSTVRGSMLQGLASREGRENLELEESLNRQRLDYDTQLSSAGLGADERISTGRLGFIERIEDEYPDFNQLIGLAQGMGQYGGGFGGGVAAGPAAKSPKSAPVGRSLPAAPTRPTGPPAGSRRNTGGVALGGGKFAMGGTLQGGFTDPRLAAGRKKQQVSKLPVGANVPLMNIF